MTTLNNPLDPETTEADDIDENNERLVHRKLADILTVSLAAARALTKRENIEVGSLIRSFKPGGDDSISRNWLPYAMASLPLDHVTLEGNFAIRPTAAATLIYQTSSSSDEDTVFAHTHTQNRAKVCQALFEELNRNEQKTYQKLVQWGPLRMADAKEHSHLMDVQIADSIYLLEDLFERRFLTYEAEARAEHSIPDYHPTHFGLIRYFAECARDDILKTTKRLVSTAGSDDNLIVRTLCNIAANRALLESAKEGELAQTGVASITALLNSMNEEGILEAPEVRDDADLRGLLLDWFGASARLATAGGAKRGLTPREIEVVIRHATQAQLTYINRRPSSHNNPQEQVAFRGPNEKLIFALALVANRKAGQRVDREKRGQHTKEYLVFDPSAEVLPVHACTLVRRQYGQITFSNDGWGLRAKKVTGYVEALSYKRACRQEMVFSVFKRLEAEKLLMLHHELMRHLPSLNDS